LNGHLNINSEDVLVANMLNHRDVELAIGRVSRDVIGVNPQISRIAQGKGGNWEYVMLHAPLPSVWGFGATLNMEIPSDFGLGQNL